MKRDKYLYVFISCFCFITLISCKQNQSGEPDDTPTSGKINITVDETFRPIIDTEISAFKNIYKYTTINVSYKSEGNAFKDLLNDSARIIIVTRELAPQEKSILRILNFIPALLKLLTMQLLL